MTTVSLVIRTLNEGAYLDDVLGMVARQRRDGFEVETVVVDSGSTDATLEIARKRGVVLSPIDKSDFSFGRALNQGCAVATGEYLVCLSGHCIPTDGDWLANLVRPLRDGVAGYSYGRQVGDDRSNFSERRIFAKYFPETSRLPQDGFFCNNANAALTRDVWDHYRFDEELTGLEDMELAKRLVADGGKVAYVADAVVFHHHNETWHQVRRRFEREAIALQTIMPDITLTRRDTALFILRSVWGDWRAARRHGNRSTPLSQMIAYRYNQYVGSLKGNHANRRPSRQAKLAFFYPETATKESHNVWLQPHRRAASDEGQQPEGQRQELR